MTIHTKQADVQPFSTLEVRQLSITFPISPVYPYLIAGFNEPNFLSGKDEDHPGIDIFAEPGTPIISPEPGILCYSNTDPRNTDLSDIALIGESGILYIFRHVATESIHQNLENVYGVNKIVEVSIPCGERIAQIASWPFKKRAEVLPRLVSAKSDGSHVHLETCYGPYTLDDARFSFPKIEGHTIDPTALFKVQDQNFINSKEISP